MKVPGRFRVGVATHTGVVRSTNEDDYLLLAPPDGAPFALAAAVADGMGGVTGGAEASRSGLRGFASGLLGAAPGGSPDAAMRHAFAGACERVHQQSRLVPALRDMGTTLTGVLFVGERAIIGHVGDTRAYRWRKGQFEQLTTDHAVAEQQNRLLRCIGGGLSEERPDLVELDLLPGDRLLLCSDGIWSAVGEARVGEALARFDAQPAAARLVQLAIAAGGPDNATALVVHLVADGDALDVDLPAEETSRAAELSRRAGGDGPARWPWPLLVLSAVLLAAVLLHVLAGIDPWAWLLSLWS